MNIYSIIRKNNKFNFAMCIVMTFIINLAQIFTAYILKEFTDIATSERYDRIPNFIIFIILCLSLYFIGNTVYVFFRNRFVKKANMQYKNYYFSKIMNQGMEAENPEKMSQYLSGLVVDMETIESNLIVGDISIFNQSILLVLGLGTMLYLSIPLTIVILVSALLPLFISGLFNNKMPILEKNKSDNSASLTALLSDLLSGYGTIKSYKIEKEVTDIFDEENNEFEDSKKHLYTGRALLNFSMNFSEILISVIVCATGLYLVYLGMITFGTAVASIQLLNYVTGPAGNLGGLLANRKAAFALVEKMQKSIDETNEVKEISQINHYNFDNAHIVMNNVGYKYDESEFEISGVTADFDMGKHYAIIGSSGSGKSSLFKLIMGRYKNYTGSISINNTKLSDMNLEDVYDNIAYIQQSTFIFNDTIVNNVSLYKDFDKEYMDSVLKSTGVDKLIDERGEGYMCGVNGANLSGGEKQRIAIARALLRKPKILLLDEATSALDKESTDSIMNMILNRKDIISISIMHKLSDEVLGRFDSTLLMDNGKLLGEGKIEELLSDKNITKALLRNIAMN